MSVIRLTPVLKDYLWGGRALTELFGRRNDSGRIAESWELSVHKDGPSGCAGGTLASYLAERPQAVNARGDRLPVLIKYIDAHAKLSVQVHPDDDYARRVEGDNGKTEMWYVLQAEEGAGVYCGFKRATTRAEVKSALLAGTVEQLLNFVPVKAGDCLLVEAGTVHAIGAGCVICEVQQSSNVTYRLYDYGRRDACGNLRPLHTDKALDVLNYAPFVNKATASPRREDGTRLLAQCRYFRCRELLLHGEYVGEARDSFVAVNVFGGEGCIDGERFAAGDSFFVPCGQRFSLSGSASALLTDSPSV